MALWMPGWYRCVNRRVQRRSSLKMNCYASGKINRSLDVLEGYLVDGTLKTDTVNLATIAIACAVGYLNFRRVAPGWCVDRPHLVKLVENLFSRESFARTEPPKA